MTDFYQPSRSLGRFLEYNRCLPGQYIPDLQGAELIAKIVYHPKIREGKVSYQNNPPQAEGGERSESGELEEKTGE